MKVLYGWFLPKTFGKDIIGQIMEHFNDKLLKLWNGKREGFTVLFSVAWMECDKKIQIAHT